MGHFYACVRSKMFAAVASFREQPENRGLSSFPRLASYKRSITSARPLRSQRHAGQYGLNTCMADERLSVLSRISVAGVLVHVQAVPFGYPSLSWGDMLEGIRIPLSVTMIRPPGLGGRPYLSPAFVGK
jgi:hypothetical protein